VFGVDARDRSHAAADASRRAMSKSDTSPSRPPRVDGRRLRSERTKQLIIEAYLALAQENSPQVPTAAEIAHRAGYSVRSVFERFPDIRTLQVAATDYALVQVAALAPARDSQGDRATRIRTQVETRGQSCERWLLLWRSLVVNQGNSPELRQRVVLSRERVVARLEFMYAAELSALTATERRHVLIALEALTDVESWARMREFFGLSFEEACLVWRQAIDRLLPPTPIT
jgi:AcrR family transcriptional regulator